MVTYPGDPQVLLERVESIPDGASANVSRLDMGVHTGTHVDAPVHFLEGTAGTNELSLDVLNGPCEVVETARLDVSAVESVPAGTERVLFKTPNSEIWALDAFPDEYERFDGAGASALVDRGVKLVGVDFLSVGDHEAHRILLAAGIVPLEGLDLRGVESGTYELHCLPLRLLGSDGAPARAILIRS
jgi:arylformamidase